MAFSPDGKTLVSGNWGASIHFWDVATGKELRRIAQEQRGLRVELTADGRFLASAGTNHKVIQLWDAATGQELRQFVGHQENIICFALAPDGDMLASASDDKTVRIWRVATGEQIHQLDRAEIVYRMAWSRDSKILAFGTTAGKVCLWDCLAAKSIHGIAGHERHISQLCWSPDDKIPAGPMGRYAYGIPTPARRFGVWVSAALSNLKENARKWRA